MNKTWYRYDIAYQEPALVGCVAQIPQQWDQKRRDEWVLAFLATLDFVHPVSEPVTDKEDKNV